MKKLIVSIKGGAGSGNWGHAGRPGLVGGSGGSGGVQYIYRGEFSQLRDKVLANGIKGKVWNNRPKSVYMTTSEREAHKYGLMKANDVNVWEYAIVRMRIPDSTILVADERDTKAVYGMSGAVRIEGNVPASWIDSVTHYDIPRSAEGLGYDEIISDLYPNAKSKVIGTVAYTTFIPVVD